MVVNASAIQTGTMIRGYNPIFHPLDEILIVDINCVVLYILS